MPGAGIDANIIVCATFDEHLEGIIRVSVVATGIDHRVTAARPQGEIRGALRILFQQIRQGRVVQSRGMGVHGIEIRHGDHAACLGME